MFSLWKEALSHACFWFQPLTIDTYFSLNIISVMYFTLDVTWPPVRDTLHLSTTASSKIWISVSWSRNNSYPDSKAVACCCFGDGYLNSFGFHLHLLKSHMGWRHGSIIGRKKDGCLNVGFVPSNLYIRATLSCQTIRPKLLVPTGGRVAVNLPEDVYNLLNVAAGLPNCNDFSMTEWWQIVSNKADLFHGAWRMSPRFEWNVCFGLS